MKKRISSVVLALILSLILVYTAQSILTPRDPLRSVNHIYYGAKPSDFLTEQMVVGDINGDGRGDVLTGIYWDDPAPGGPPRATATCGGAHLVTNGVETVRACDNLNFTYWTQTLGYTDLGPTSCPDSCYWYPVETEDEGAAMVFYGGNYDNVPYRNDLNTTSPGLTIYGQNAGDKLLFVATGNINAGQFSDMLIGAPQFDLYKAGSRGPYYVQKGRGEAFVIFGSANLPATIDLRNSSDVSTYVHNYLSGRDLLDRFGYSNAVGDINGSLSGGEIVIGAPWGDGSGNGRLNSGEVYVFYPGGSPPLPGSVDLSTVTDAAMAGYGQVIYGAAEGDHIGITDMEQIDPNSRYAPPTIAIGDWDQDGVDDLAIGAGNAQKPSDPTANDRGALYIIFGTHPGDQFPKLVPGNTIDLANAPSGSDVHACDMVFYGAAQGDALGSGVEFADVDGDGHKDLLLGAPLADNDDGGSTKINRGEAYIVFSAPRTQLTQTRVRDLSVSQSVVDVVIYGDDAGDEFGAYFAGNGDFDLDNYSDFAIGGRYAAPDDSPDEHWGQAAVFFGQSHASWMADTQIHLKTALYNTSHKIFKIVSEPDGESNTVRLTKIDTGNENADLVFGGYDADGYTGSSDPNAGQMYIMKGRDVWKTGTISANQTWRDNVFVTDDLTIAQGVTVTIEGGTDVYVWPADWNASNDGGSQPYVDASRVELVVKGFLQVNGTIANPVRFITWSDSLHAVDSDAWWGIKVQNVSGAGASFNYCTVANALNGIQTDVGITVSHCTIENCREGLTVDGSGASLDSAYVTNTKIRNIIGNSDGSFGVNVRYSNGAVRLNNCRIENCRIGVRAADHSRLWALTDTIATTELWGVRVNSNGYGSLADCIIEGAATNALEVYSSGHVFAGGCTLKTSDYGADVADIGGGHPRLTLSECTVTGNDTGLHVTDTPNVDIPLSHIDNNTTDGVHCLSGADIVVAFATMNGNNTGLRCDDSNVLITDNTISGNAHGIVCEGFANPTLRRNKIWSNGTGIAFADNSSADMSPCGGEDCSGCADANSFKTSTYYHVSTLTNPIYATCNYWGKSVPRADKFYGDVYYVPYMSSDPLPTSMKPREEAAVPRAYALSGNSPNPFNPTTTIRYDVPSPGGQVRIRIYNVQGQLVRTLISRNEPAGQHQVMWDGTDQRGGGVSSGVYFLEMTASQFRATRKIMMLK